MVHISRISGFTLIEIMVVMVIIAIITGAVALSVSGGSHRQLQEEAEQLRNAFQLAADEAIYDVAQTGVMLTQDSYQFIKYNNARHMWEPFTDRPLRGRHLPEPFSFSLTTDNTVVPLPPSTNGGKLLPSLLFLSSGEITPFSLTLTSRSDKEYLTFGTDGVAPIAMQKASHDD